MAICACKPVDVSVYVCVHMVVSVGEGSVGAEGQEGWREEEDGKGKR